MYTAFVHFAITCEFLRMLGGTQPNTTLTMTARFCSVFFSFALSTLLVAAGCNSKKAEPTASPNENPAETSSLSIPLPTAEMLTALGPENDIEIDRLLPEPIFVVAGYPKLLLTSPLGKGSEQLISEFLVQFLQVSFNPIKIERFVQSSAFPAQVPIGGQPDGNNLNPTPPRIVPIARRSTILKFDEPITVNTILTPMLGDSVNDQTIVESLKRTEGKSVYYDVTPQNNQTPQRLALALLDDRTAVFVEGLADDVKAVFRETGPKNAVLDRVKRLDMGAGELFLVTSLEGAAMKPEILEGLLQQIGMLPQNLITAASKHLRALAFSFHVAAEVGKPVLSLRIEGRDEKGSAAINEAGQGMLVNAQTTLAAMDDAAKKAFPIPTDFAALLLNSVVIEAKGTQTNVVLNNFDNLIPTVAAGLQSRQSAMIQAQIQQQRAQQLTLISQLCAAYYQKNQKFPSDILSADGKPLLSWRIALLPTLGLEDLYRQFKLDEPWDGPTNKPLLDKMPSIFRPLIQNVAPPKTVVRYFNSAGTPLSNPNLKPEEIKNPQSTLAFVSVTPDYAVEWTKPEPLVYNAEKVREVFGGALFGISFANQIFIVPLLTPESDQFERQNKEIEALVLGLPMPYGQEQ
jgi:hypothetical protein